MRRADTNAGREHGRMERAYQAALAVGLSMLGFFVPFSTAGTSLSMALLLVLFLPAARRIWKLEFRREPIHVAGFILLGYIVLRAVPEGPWMMLKVARYYQELLMLAVLWGLLRLSRQPAALGALISRL